jgi:hypothetical protein
MSPRVYRLNPTRLPYWPQEIIGSTATWRCFGAADLAVVVENGPHGLATGEYDRQGNGPGEKRQASQPKTTVNPPRAKCAEELSRPSGQASIADRQRRFNATRGDGEDRAVSASPHSGQFPALLHRYRTLVGEQEKGLRAPMRHDDNEVIRAHAFLNLLSRCTYI